MGNALSADEVSPLIGLRFKFGTVNQSAEAIELILESEMPGAGKKKLRMKKRKIYIEIRREN